MDFCRNRKVAFHENISIECDIIYLAARVSMMRRLQESVLLQAGMLLGMFLTKRRHLLRARVLLIQFESRAVRLSAMRVASRAIAIVIFAIF